MQRIKSREGEGETQSQQLVRGRGSKTLRIKISLCFLEHIVSLKWKLIVYHKSQFYVYNFTYTQKDS